MLFALLEKVLIIFATNQENINSVIHNEAGNGTKRIKINYQINESSTMEKIEMCYFQSLK